MDASDVSIYKSEQYAVLEALLYTCISGSCVYSYMHLNLVTSVCKSLVRFTQQTSDSSMEGRVLFVVTEFTHHLPLLGLLSWIKPQLHVQRHKLLSYVLHILSSDPDNLCSQCFFMYIVTCR